MTFRAMRSTFNPCDHNRRLVSLIAASRARTKKTVLCGMLRLALDHCSTASPVWLSKKSLLGATQDLR
jgi:hypothetical protein